MQYAREFSICQSFQIMLVNKRLNMVLFGVYIWIISLCVNSGYVQSLVGISDHASILDCFFILYMCASRLGYFWLCYFIGSWMNLR